MATKKALKLPGVKNLLDSVIPGSKTSRSAFTTNLSSIKEALTPAKKKQAKERFEKAKSKSSYTFRELPIPKQKNFVEYSQYLESHSNQMDKLLGKGEMWAATYMNKNAHTHLPFEKMHQLIAKLNEYKDSEKFGKSTDMSELVSKIRIIKFKSPDGTRRSTKKAYEAMKAKEIEENKIKRTNREKKAEGKARAEKKRADKKEVQLKKERAARRKERAAQKKKEAANKKQIAALKSQVKKLVGDHSAKKKIGTKAKPKSGKKATKKTTVTKKSGNKTTKKNAPKKSAVKKSTKPSTSHKKVTKPVTKKSAAKRSAPKQSKKKAVKKTTTKRATKKGKKK